MSIESKVQSLITASNAKTGETDTNLTAAVQRLIDGFGQGGGASTVNGRAFDCGTFSFQADRTTAFTINHSLGRVPSAFWLYIVDPPTQENGTNLNYKIGAVRMISGSSANSMSLNFANGSANSASGLVYRIEWTDTTVRVPASTTYPLRAGLTYEWIALGGIQS